MFIISRLNVKSNESDIVFSSASVDDCKSKLFDVIHNNEDYMGKFIGAKYIKSYKIVKGFFYNSYRLEFIYQILEVGDNE